MKLRREALHRLVNLGPVHKGTKELRLQVLITHVAHKTIDTFVHASYSTMI